MTEAAGGAREDDDSLRVELVQGGQRLIHGGSGGHTITVRVQAN